MSEGHVSTKPPEEDPDAGKEFPPVPKFKGDPVAQVRRGRYIAEGRARVLQGKHRPRSYRDLGADLGISARTAEILHRRFVEGGWDALDRSASETIEHSIDTQTMVLAEAWDAVREADEQGDLRARIAALKVVSDVDLVRLRVLQAAGRVPSRLSDVTAAEERQQFINRLAMFAQKHLTLAQQQALLEELGGGAVLEGLPPADA